MLLFLNSVPFFMAVMFPISSGIVMIVLWKSFLPLPPPRHILILLSCFYFSFGLIFFCFIVRFSSKVW